MICTGKDVRLGLHQPCDFRRNWRHAHCVPSPKYSVEEKVDSFWFVQFDSIHRTLFVILAKSAHVQRKVKERQRQRERQERQRTSHVHAMPKGARTLVKAFAPAAAYAHLPLTRSEASLRIL